MTRLQARLRLWAAIAMLPRLGRPLARPMGRELMGSGPSCRGRSAGAAPKLKNETSRRHARHRQISSKVRPPRRKRSRSALLRPAFLEPDSSDLARSGQSLQYYLLVLKKGRATCSKVSKSSQVKSSQVKGISVCRNMGHGFLEDCVLTLPSEIAIGLCAT